MAFTDWLWWWSLINGTLFGAQPVGTDGVPTASIDEADINVDPEAGTFLISADFDTVDAGDRVIVRLSRPMPNGRVPRREDTRSIGVIVPGEETDVAALYVQKFGRLPGVGSTVLAVLRAGLPSTGQASEESSFLAIAGASEQADWCEATDPGGEYFPFESFGVDCVGQFEPVDPMETVTVESLTPSFPAQGASQLVNGENGLVNFDDMDGIPGTYTVNVRFTLDGSPGRTCDDSFEVTIADFI